ncbi:MAG TPA: S8 family serine peptidase, partial [Nitrospiraceae bacterium]|nr:S8 family serine peptidase [Nitrospiraceae bacterium]
MVERAPSKQESSIQTSSQKTEFTPRVIIKFHDSINVPYEDQVERYLDKFDDEFWPIFSKQFPGVTFQKLFHSVAPQRILKLVEQARRTDRTYLPPNFLTYFALPIPTGINAQAVAEALSSRHAIVERAYVEGVPSGPNNPYYDQGPSDPYWPGQRYLRGEADIDDPSGVKIKVSGIDAEYAWTVPGGDGGGATAGLQFVDLERGWFLDHRDLPAGKIILDGSNQYLEHGTSVLGIVVAQDNCIGCIGIAPKVATMRAVSYYRPTVNLADAIQAALNVMNFGDVLLLEVQMDYCGYPMAPLEIQPDLFDLIRLGTALGIIIVEAAGDGNLNLDNVPCMPQKDSGAIMVGAASMTAPHSRPAYANFSNYGSRINCYAWGENIVTLGTSPDNYVYGFGATSGASAIVAGAALSVQGVSITNNGFRLSPQQMRTLLGDPALGIQSQNPAVDKVGVMPNLKNIIPVVLTLTPDIYIRDNETDTGAPHTGPICESPDIILLPAMITLPDTPQGKYGEGSGTESDKTLGFEAEAGQDNFIYVRMRN